MAKKKTNTLLWVGGGVAVAGALGYYWWAAQPFWLVIDKQGRPTLWVKLPNLWKAKKAKRLAEDAWGASVMMTRDNPPEGAMVSDEWVATDVEAYLSGIGNAPAQVQEWGRRGQHLGPYHANSTHGDSPFLFGLGDGGHYHQITLPDGTPWRTHKDYLTGLGKAQRMKAEAWKDGSYSWVDITPRGGPKMRITHQIFAGERGAG